MILGTINTIVSDFGLLMPKISLGMPMIRKFSPSLLRMLNWVICPSVPSSVMSEKIRFCGIREDFAKSET